MKASAFAPAHVSGLFSVHDEATDVLARGSRGAGWSVTAGAHAFVEPAPATRIRINGREEAAPVTRAALATLGGTWAVDLRLDLPVSQGFGMSAAGTLATCLAVSSIRGVEPERALEATHAAEVAAGTGLGDAIGSWNGAAEVRMRPGIPPHGWAMRIDAPEAVRFLYCVLGEGIPTPSVVRDATWKKRTRALGDAAVDRLVGGGRATAWEAILGESARFSQELGLMPPAMAVLGTQLPKSCLWGQTMLGTTMWVTGDDAALAQARKSLGRAGPIFEFGVDPNGARLAR